MPMNDFSFADCKDWILNQKVSNDIRENNLKVFSQSSKVDKSLFVSNISASAFINFDIPPRCEM
jgi:hypothetical protein